MSDSTGLTIGYTDGDVDTNNSNNPSLNEMIDARYSRRQTLRGGATALATAVLGGSALAACDTAEFVPNDNPTVGAGSSGATTSGRMVTLTGTASDGDTIGAVAWSQTVGPVVTLSNPSTNTSTFLAPSVAAPTDLVFQFVAADSKGATSIATTTVTVSPAQLGFAAVAKNKLDVVTVPAGYSVQILTRLGDPIAAGVPAYANNGTDSDFANRIGDHGDALYWYGLNAAGARDDNGSTRGLMVQNHENLNIQYLHPTGPTMTAPRPEAEAIKEIEAHGVSVVECVEGANRAWTYVQGSAFNRRITPLTPVVFNGPVKGSPWLVTAYSPTGVAGRGTINNCANGHTLWGTNLTCEENWAGYFRRPNTDDVNRTPRELVALRRYGLANAAGSSYLWETVVPADPANTSFARWNATVTGGAATADFRNEANQFGWVVEHDPYDKTQAPRNRARPDGP